MLDELKILYSFLPRLTCGGDVAVGPGDDCAAVRIGDGVLLLLAADQLIEAVHYDPALVSSAEAGAKLLKRNLSDIAAMGGFARFALVSYAANGKPSDEVLNFLNGIADEAERWHVQVIGGDLAAMPVTCGVATVASLSIVGTVEESCILRRSGASSGDLLCVTGSLGNSYASGHHVSFLPRLAEGRFLAEHHYASAMMDISDGLVLDAERMGRASQVEFVIDLDALPLRDGATVEGALTDGEDYELLFTIPKEKYAALLKEYPDQLAPVTVIGRAEKGAGVWDSECRRDLLKGKKIGYVH
ncbi:MAG: thiamine-phosphate kinase [Victivallaceae bacterium]|nr:thiamine-phosphate kinase [Victivallaceae bacterium]